MFQRLIERLTVFHLLYIVFIFKIISAFILILLVVNCNDFSS